MSRTFAFLLLGLAGILAVPGAAAQSGLQFDGSDDHVRIPHAEALSFAPAAEATFEFWVRPAAGGGWHLLGKRASCFDIGETANYQVFVSIPGGIEFNSGACFTVATGIPGEQWSHLAFVADAGGTRIYVDGALAGSSACPLGGSNEADVWIGASTACPARYQGIMDEVRIWNVARSQSDILADLQRVLPGDTPGLVGVWRFEEPADSQLVLDDSPQALDGTLGSDAFAGSDDPLRVASEAPAVWRIFADGFETPPD